MRDRFVTDRLAAGAWAAAFAVLFVSWSCGCSKTPAEPDAPEPVGSAAPAPAVAPLAYDVPAGWTVLPGRTSGVKKAAFKVPTAGSDKEEGELAVFFHGTGAGGDPDVVFKDWFAKFDGDVGASATREKMEVRGMKVEIVDTAGTYKVGLGPAVGPKKKTPVQMVKEHFRLHMAVVKTPDRGNWFFVLTGPDETVQAATGGFKTMLESVH